MALSFIYICVYIHTFHMMRSKLLAQITWLEHLMNLNSSVLRCKFPSERGFALIWILRRSLTFLLASYNVGMTTRQSGNLYRGHTYTRAKEANEGSGKYYRYLIIFSGQFVSKLGEFWGSDAETVRSLLHSHIYLYIYYWECSGSLRVLLTTPTTAIVSSHGPKVSRWSPVVVEIPNAVCAHTRHVNIARSFALCLWHRVSIFSQEVIWMARYRSFSTIRGNKAGQYLRKHNIVQYENGIIYFISLYWFLHVLKYTIMSRIFQKYAKKREKISIKYDILYLLFCLNIKIK